MNPERLLLVLPIRQVMPRASLASLACLTFALLERMLDAQCVDGIIVAVPTPLHCKVALTAIRRGIAVLIEKPITEHPGEAAELIADSPINWRQNSCRASSPP